MTDRVTELVRYAIHLPNGELASDIGDRDSDGGSWEKIPGSASTYLWPTPDQARAIRDKMADDAAALGLSGQFREFSRVVRVTVRTTVDVEIRPVADSPSVEAEVAGVSEPRTWPHVDDIPTGVVFRVQTAPDVPTNRYERRVIDCLHIASGSAFSSSHFAYVSQDFIEVLPEPAEPKPRTWATAEEIPHEVKVSPIKGGEGFTYWRDPLLNDTFESVNGQIGESSLTASWPDGFIEVPA